MKVWVLMDGDSDGDWIVAIYDNVGAADDHQSRAPYLRIQAHDVLTLPVAEIAERLT
jgi:N6-adenosine-specific RNA methylase IME4